MNHKKPCNEKCEIYSRVVGFLRPLKNWNTGKQEEFKERKVYKLDDDMKPVLKK